MVLPSVVYQKERWPQKGGTFRHFSLINTTIFGYVSGIALLSLSLSPFANCRRMCRIATKVLAPLIEFVRFSNPPS